MPSRPSVEGDGLSGFWIKEHSSPQGQVLAVADADLVGKVLKQGKIVFRVSEHFYKGELVEEAELKEKLSQAQNINLVGEKSFQVAKGMGFLQEKDILRIEGVPHAHVYKL